MKIDPAFIVVTCIIAVFVVGLYIAAHQPQGHCLEGEVYLSGRGLNPVCVKGHQPNYY